MATRPQAIFFETPFKKRTVSRESITDDNRDDFKKGVLMDLDERLLLYVRRSKDGFFHFTQKKKSQVKHVLGSDMEELKESKDREANDPAHNKRVDRILELMNQPIPTLGKTVEEIHNFATVEVYTFRKRPPAKADKKKRGRLARLLARIDRNTYRWGKEARRFIQADGLVVHDVYGHSTDTSMSISRPDVAIEVVVSHAPGPQTIARMLYQTSIAPLLILFEFLDNKDLFYFDAWSVPMRIEANCFMVGGVLYDCNTPIASATDEDAHERLKEWALGNGAHRVKG